MKGDFTRDTFDAAKHFSRVLMQQGRVQLDADWNEQASILLHYLRALATDLIGPHGGPTGEGKHFALSALTTGESSYNVAIGPGRYYVDGILCENDAPGCTIRRQPDYPERPNADGKLALQDALGDRSAGRLLIYLDVWERHITRIEDGQIAEPALGEADTATRAKVIWQVKAHGKQPAGDAALPDNFDCAAAKTYWDDWVSQWQSDMRGALKATVKDVSGANTDPCVQSPESKYRGRENQLYRVEIHKGGVPNEATFKWSRDNGSVAAAWLQSEEDTDPNGILVSNARGFEAGGWVELTHDDLELMGEPGSLVKISAVDGNVLLKDSEHSGGAMPWDENFKYPKVRRWDQRDRGDVKADENAVPVKSRDNQPIELEDGIEVLFDVSPGTTYRSGDYWLIPARVATGDIEWPRDENDEARFAAPHGVTHHYAPLGVVAVSSGGTVTIATNGNGDCRCFIEPANSCAPAP